MFWIQTAYFVLNYSLFFPLVRSKPSYGGVYTSIMIFYALLSLKLVQLYNRSSSRGFSLRSDISRWLSFLVTILKLNKTNEKFFFPK